MKCHEFEELIIPFYDKELDAATANSMEQHMQSCAACAALYRQVTAAYMAFDDMPAAPDLDSGLFYEGVAAKAGFRKTSPVIRLMHRTANVAATVIFAAGLSAGIIAGSQVLQQQSQTGTQQEDFYSSLASDFHLSTEQEYSLENYLTEEDSAPVNE